MSQLSRCIHIPVVALCAMATLWAHPAEATFVSCQAGANQAFSVYAGTFTFSTECVSGFLGTSTDVAGEAHMVSNHSGIQSNLTWAANTTDAHAYAFGYRIGASGPEQIPGCVADDTSADGVWKTKTCSESVTYISLVVNGG